MNNDFCKKDSRAKFKLFVIKYVIYSNKTLEISQRLTGKREREPESMKPEDGAESDKKTEGGRGSDALVADEISDSSSEQ